MNDFQSELRSAAAMSRAHEGYLESPEKDRSCPLNVCGGTGYVPGSETEHLYGDRCPAGCEPPMVDEIDRIRKQGQG